MSALPFRWWTPFLDRDMILTKSRTNSLAFAKTDCHTCAGNKRQCDRKRPRCSPCLSSGIVCGGYPMKLKWSNRKPMQPGPTVLSDGPFRLDPLSFCASLHTRDRSRLPKPHKPRQFRFKVDKSSNKEQAPTESHQNQLNSTSARQQRGDSFQQVERESPIGNHIDQNTEVDFLPGIVDDIYGGTSQYTLLWTILTFLFNMQLLRRFSGAI